MNPPNATEHRNRMAEFQRKHRTGLVTLVFTDLVDSVALRRQLGDQAGTSLLQAHRQLVRETVARFTDAEEIETAGDSFLLLFARPSDAVKFALLVQMQTRALTLTRPSGRREEAPADKSEIRSQKSEISESLTSAATALKARIGIHVGEVVIEEHERGPKLKDVYGTQIDLCARVMGLAEGGQILLTRGVFDSARQALKGEDIEGLNELNELQGGSQLQWLNYGPYLLKGIEESVEVCEVGETGAGVLKAPAGSEKAQRQVSPDSEPVLGWRPALGQVVPNTKWVLEKKLGEGGFGEVWLGRHQTMKERRVFKFCFRADRVRSLKREMTLFRVLKQHVGDHPNIVGIQEVFFDEPPFYIVMDYAEAKDLRTWSEERGGVKSVPLETRLEIVAQVADALQAAHQAEVIHRDVKPSNILVSSLPAVAAPVKARSDVSSGTMATLPNESQPAPSQAQLRVQVKLTDFGIGQVVSQEALAGMTRLGFTQTMISDSSSSHTGSQMYMAPELLAGKPASTRSDIYSLGVVLYQLLVGDLTRPLTTDWVRSVNDPLLREDLEKCFAGRPEERFASARELADRLRSLEERRSVWVAGEKAVRYRRIVRQGAVATLVAGLFTILGIYAFKQQGSNPTQAVSLRTNSVEVGGTKNPQADDRYKRGESALFSNTGLSGLTNAVRWFQEAIDLDPDFARAYADLADACRKLDSSHEPRKGWDAKAMEAVNKAISLAPRMPDSYVVRGALYFTPSLGWDYERDIREQRYAIELDPNVKDAHFEMALVFLHLGFLDEAVAELDMEMAIYPLDPGPLWIKGNALTWQGKYDEALRLLNSIPTEAFLSPRIAAWQRGICLFYLGRTNEASALLESVLKEFPDDSLLTSMQAILYAASGETNTAKQKIEIAKTNEKPFIHFHHVSYNIASAYALMREDVEAMHWLKRSVKEGFPCYTFFLKDRNLNNLRGNPKFMDFMEEQRKQHERYKALLKP